MVDPNTVASILNNLRRSQDKLSILAQYTQKDFLHDFTKIESAKHLLQVSIEGCLNLAHHIIADEGFRTPKDSYDAFVVLNEQGILPNDFMPALRQMVSFRNRAVHLYWDVDDAAVYDIVQHNLGDFDSFTGHILRFLQTPSD